MRLTALRVSPANCQVALVVPDAEEAPPDWPTGHEVVGKLRRDLRLNHL